MTSIRRPDLLTAENPEQLARQTQQALDDIIDAMTAPGVPQTELLKVRWEDDGGSKQLRTQVAFPRVIMARATVEGDGGGVMVTGSVSFYAEDRDQQAETTNVVMTDISGLSSGTTYDVWLLIAGEVK